MTIKWANVVAFALAIFALVLIIKMPGEMGAFLATMQFIGSGNPEEEVIGLLAFGLVMLLIVAVVKIIIDGNHKD